MSARSRSVILIWFLAVCGFAPLAAACNRARSALKPPPPPKTVVHVSNGDFLDAVIYVVQQGQRVRLGTATSNTTTMFVIPAQLVFSSTSLSFLIDPVGSTRRQSSGQIVVDPGDDVELQLSAGRIMLGKKPS